jgi:hypothetical protein
VTLGQDLSQYFPFQCQSTSPPYLPIYYRRYTILAINSVIQITYLFLIFSLSFSVSLAKLSHQPKSSHYTQFNDSQPNNKLIKPQNKTIFWMLVIPRLVKNFFSKCMEIERSLQYSQKPPLVPIPSQTNLVHFNIILQCTRRSSQLSLSLGFLANILYLFLVFPTHITFPVYHIFLA